jgi:hypothetical protein
MVKNNEGLVVAESVGQYEFNASQNQAIGTLARRMLLVGMVLILFGLFQMVNGLTSVVMSRSPERVIAAAENAGMSADQIEQLKLALAQGFWSSPFTISSLAFAVAGLLMLLVGVWTRQAAVGFAEIVRTEGNDITRLMDAVGALNMKYGMMYYMILIAAIMSLISLAIGLFHMFSGGS